jgi:hypothetical protein
LRDRVRIVSLASGMRLARPFTSVLQELDFSGVPCIAIAVAQRCGSFFQLTEVSIFMK